MRVSEENKDGKVAYFLVVDLPEIGPVHVAEVYTAELAYTLVQLWEYTKARQQCPAD